MSPASIRSSWPSTTDFRAHARAPAQPPRLREGGTEPAQVQALLGHSSVETSARHFRAGASEQTAVVDQVFEL
ncbi:hypothetical protein ABZ470_21420 [Streptosporangium sp. NPDC020072]|uniref:hypothetical protein n=1 Tax=Streptosporangium sp. NPDC020072 TaxID=3154788 RepID=UPI00343DC14A